MRKTLVIGMFKFSLPSGSCSLFSTMYRCVKLVVLLLVIFTCGVNAEYQNYADVLESPDYKEVWNLLAPEKMLTNHYKTLNDYGDKVLETSTCRRDLMALEKAIRDREIWALQMLDASSKIPSGLMKGNIIDLGQYDECMAIRSNTTINVIRGRHCMYSIEVTSNSNETIPIDPTLSVCLPASCSADSIDEFFNKTISWIDKLKNIKIKIVLPRCSPIDPIVWDVEFITCLVILAIFVMLLTACTAIELRYRSLHAGHYRNPVLGTLAMFSLRKSASSIFNMEIKEGTLPAIHGIRCLSMAWVVLGHEFVISILGVNVNTVDYMTWVQSWKSLYVFLAPFAVDTFFTMSGFLMTYLFLKQMPKQKKFNLPMYYLHRYFRLTPAVIALLFFTIVFVPKFGSGARWEVLLAPFFGSCQTKWWPSVLYVQNFVDKENMCLGHLWYISTETQLYWISPFILYPLYKKPKFGLMILAALFLASIAIPASVIGVKKLPVVSFMHKPDINVTMEVFMDIYEIPYHRAGPWLIGIFLGYEVEMYNRRLNKWTIAAGWLTAIASFAFCTFGTRAFMDPDYVYNDAWETFFAVVCRPIWAVGVCWIIYASIKNCAGPLSSILSARIFLPLSRLSYCVYLVHIVIQTMNAASQRTPNYFSDYYIWRSYISTLMISIVVAFIFSLLFESPIMVLEKILFNRKGESKSELQKQLINNNEDEESREQT